MSTAKRPAIDPVRRAKPAERTHEPETIVGMTMKHATASDEVVSDQTVPVTPGELPPVAVSAPTWITSTLHGLGGAAWALARHAVIPGSTARPRAPHLTTAPPCTARA